MTLKKGVANETDGMRTGVLDTGGNHDAGGVVEKVEEQAKEGVKGRLSRHLKGMMQAGLDQCGDPGSTGGVIEVYLSDLEEAIERAEALEDWKSRSTLQHGPDDDLHDRR